MKNMKKLVALFAATVMTMSLSVSAFAATVDSTGTVADEDFTLVFTPAEDGSDDKIDQLTMIAYLVDAEKVKTVDDIPAYDSQEIVALDQVGGSDGFGDVPVNIEKLTTGYAIAVVMGGSTGTTTKALITYNEEEETVEVLIGDVDGSGSITSTDADYVSAYVAAANKETYNTDNDKQIGITIATNVIIGDVDGSGSITSTDADYISAYVAAANKETYNADNSKEIGVLKSFSK